MTSPNHSIAGLGFPQIFILTTQGGPIWAVFNVPSHRTKLYGRNYVYISAAFT